MIQTAVLALSLCGTAQAVRPPAASLEPAAMWVRIFHEKTSDYEYIETEQDGKALYVNVSSGTMLMESGEIRQELVKDLLRELKNADTFDIALEKPRGYFMFMRGATYEITASHKGELLTARVPESNLTTGFKLALNEVRQAVVKLPRMTGVYRFATARMLNKESLFAPETRPGRRAGTVMLEMSDIETMKPLNRALLKPYRLIPLANKTQYDQLAEFMAFHNVVNEENVYHFSTLRGQWRLDVIDPGEGAAVSPKAKRAKSKSETRRKPRKKKQARDSASARDQEG